jgi:hypothetical protein
MRQLIQVAYCGLLVTFIPACSGSSSPSHAAPVPQSQAPNGLINAFCNGYQACCGSKGFAFNAAACDANLRAQITSDVCPAPRVYDPQAAGDCIAEIQATYSVCSSSSAAMSACQQVCTGSTPMGSPCTTSQDCVKSSTGVVMCGPTSTSGATSVCSTETHGKAGDSCSETCTMSADGNIWSCYVQAATSGDAATAGTAHCYTNEGVYCASDYVCRPLIAIGANCTVANSCAQGAYCDPTTSRCTQKVALGSICSLANGVCVDGGYCTTSLICAAKKGAGAACTGSEECLGYCDPTTQTCAGSTAFSVTAASCANPTAQ